MVETLFKFLKLLEDEVRIIKVVKRIEANGSKKKSNNIFLQSSLSKNASQSKKRRKFGSTNHTKDKYSG